MALYTAIICDTTYLDAAGNVTGSAMLENLDIKDIEKLIEMAEKQCDTHDIIIRPQVD